MAGTAVNTVRLAILAGLNSALASEVTAQNVQILDGTRPPFLKGDVVALTGLTIVPGVANISPTRWREEMYEAQLVFSSTLAVAKAEQQPTVNARAHALYALWDSWLITAPNETLGLAYTYIPRAWMTEFQSQPWTDPDLLAQGRNCTINATLTVRVRV